VTDISVSRSHAYITYDQGKFFLFDNESKFGTLIQLKQPYELPKEKTIIQCGKTVVLVSHKLEEVEKIPEPTLEIVEEIGTPSTLNDAENDTNNET
jgi:ABC-type uncharacterized transport system ATPase subunit